jgi:two-component sensor histidine kinase/PAS domain-containing protein
MRSWLASLFGPGGQSGSGPTGLDLLHAVGDGVIAATFLLVPVVLLYLYRRRGQGSAGEAALVKLFLLFIFAVGLVHFAAVLQPWMPGREFEGVLKGAAALLAVATAIGLWWLGPHLVRVPSRDRLQAEINAHLKTLDELKAARLELEARVEARTKRFEIALRGSPISVFSQDKDLRFTWVHNLPAGLKRSALIGKTDADILPPDAAKKIIAAKRKAMETGTSQELEIDFALRRRERSFYFVIEPLRADDGTAVTGTASVAVDITERKTNEHHLRLLLRELTHRSKNLLAVIHAIARQTAARTTTVDDFLDRFGARLYAISCSHDLLIADDWHGASLRMLVEQQLEAHAERFGERIAIEGEDIILKPEAVHNLGLALHELTTNAEKYGSLSEGLGEIRIQWDFCEEAKELKLIWQETGGPEVSPPERSGFGRAMLERVVGKALAGDVTLSFPAKGVRCEIVIPAAHVTSRG